MDAPLWYDQWFEDAFDQLRAKQAALGEAFGVGRWPHYDYDLAAGTLTFSDKGAPKVRAEVQVVGTTGSDDWLWSWANPHLPQGCSEAVAAVRAFGEEHAIGELTQALQESENLDGLGWGHTAVAVRLLDAPGAYRAPRDAGGATFFVCTSFARLS